MHNIHKKQTPLPPAGFETWIPANEQAQTDALTLTFNEPMIMPLCKITTDVGPCHHGMARPQVADGGTASNMEGSCEKIE